MGKDIIDHNRMHGGGHGFEENNKAGERVLNFTSAYELAILNTFFRTEKNII